MSRSVDWRASSKRSEPRLPCLRFAVMKRSPILLAAASLVFVAFCPISARAAAPIDRAFGNTILSTYPDGRQAELWLRPGGVYHAKGRRGDDSSGRWNVDGNRLCLSQRRPFPAPFHFCTPIPERFDGAWSARAVTGEHIRVRLVHGRVVGRTGPPRGGH